MCGEIGPGDDPDIRGALSMLLGAAKGWTLDDNVIENRNCER